MSPSEYSYSPSSGASFGLGVGYLRETFVTCPCALFLPPGGE